MSGTVVAPEEGPRGIGGWLVLPALGLVITPFSILFSLIKDYLPIFQQGYWPLLTTPGNQAYHPYWGPLLIFEIAVNLALLVFVAVLIQQFFTKSYRLPRLMVAYFVARLVFVIVDVLFASQVPAVAAQSDPTQTMRTVLTTLAAAAIWIPYFLASKRVKNTFVEGRPGTGPQPAAGPPADAQQHLGLAGRYEARNEFVPALRECNLAIQLAPDNADAHNLRGIILESLGRGQEAVEAYREAVRLAPAFVEARENLADAEAELAEAALPEAELQPPSLAAGSAGSAATEREPSIEPAGDVTEHLALAYGYEAQDAFAAALRECEVAIELMPDCAEAHNLRGIILESLGRGQEAVEAYRTAVRFDPTSADAQVNLAEAEALYEKVGPAEQAAQGDEPE